MATSKLPHQSTTTTMANKFKANSNSSSSNSKWPGQRRPSPPSQSSMSRRRSKRLWCRWPCLLSRSKNPCLSAQRPSQQGRWPARRQLKHPPSFNQCYRHSSKTPQRCSSNLRKWCRKRSVKIADNLPHRQSHHLKLSTKKPKSFPRVDHWAVCNLVIVTWAVRTTIREEPSAAWRKIPLCWNYSPMGTVARSTRESSFCRQAIILCRRCLRQLAMTYKQTTSYLLQQQQQVYSKLAKLPKVQQSNSIRSQRLTKMLPATTWHLTISHSNNFWHQRRRLKLSECKIRWPFKPHLSWRMIKMMCWPMFQTKLWLLARNQQKK